MFTETFDNFVCEGDSISCEIDGFTCTATLYADDHSSPPWKRDCGHGPVSNWTSRNKLAGEMVLSEDCGSKRFYDFKEACKTALADGWGVEGGKLEGESAKQYATRAATHDFEVLKAWCNDEWHYYGVAVTIRRDDIRLTGKYDHACWGSEGNYPGGDNSNLTALAGEYLEGALAAAKAKLAALCSCVEKESAK